MDGESANVIPEYSQNMETGNIVKDVPEEILPRGGRSETRVLPEETLLEETLSSDEFTDSDVVKLQDKFQDLSLNSTLASTPLGACTIPEDVATVQEEVVFEEVQLYDKGDGKEVSFGDSFRGLHTAQEIPGYTAENVRRASTSVTEERIALVTTEERRTSWTDGLGWYERLKRVEKGLDLYYKRDDEISSVDQFITSAVMVSPSDLDGTLSLYPLYFIILIPLLHHSWTNKRRKKRRGGRGSDKEKRRAYCQHIPLSKQFFLRY